MLSNTCTRAVAFLEVAKRFGPEGFRKSNTPFKPIPGITEWRDTNDAFATYAADFNRKLELAVEEEKRIFYVPLKGMHDFQRSWMYDGCHYHYNGEMKLQSMMRMAAIGMLGLR